MAKELEYKLQVESEALLTRILLSREVSALSDGEWRTLAMQTTYFDNTLHQFSKRHWTLRHRLEGGIGVACLKTPSEHSHTRNEWQVEANALDDAAIAALVREGAPRELLALYASAELVALCGAKFTRRCVMLRFADGTRAELAGDLGYLHGASGTLPLSELELELYEGNAETVLAFVRELCRRYDLHEQPRSKFARAKTLK